VAVTTVAFALLAPLVAGPAAAAAGSGSKGDAAAAKQGVLRISDFPAGWSQSRHQESKSSGVASCRATDRMIARSKKYRAQSPDFSQGDTSRVENTVYVFPKPAKATAYLRPFQAAAAQRCIQQGTEKALRKFPGTTVQVGKLDLTSALASGQVDDAVGYEGLATVPQQGGAVKLYVLAVAVRMGRAVVGFTIQSQDQVLPETDTLIDASLSRLQAALG
jgi:hypothetical protein